MSDRHISSTGPDTAVWPPQTDTTHNRAKGFFPIVINSDSDLRDFAGHMRNVRDGVTERHTRLSVRVVSEIGLLSSMEQALRPSGIRLEAAIPLSGTQRSLAAAYTGWNAPQRIMRAARRADNLGTINSAVSRPRSATRTDQLAALDLQASLIDHTTPTAEREALIPRFAGIYALFGYSAVESAELLRDPANVIAYAHDDNGVVVSTAMVAYEAPRISGTPIPMGEVTEAFTLPAYRGQGLYRTISGILLTHITTSDAHAVLAIYGESNLAMPGVVNAAHENGRQFSSYDRQLLGVINPGFGILPQAFRIEDGRPDRPPYNDLAVSYLPLGGRL